MADKIILKKYCKTIRGNLILDNIDLELDAGGVYGFFGRNASGKTMLLRAVCGLIGPTSGSAEVFGKNISETKTFPDSIGIQFDDVDLIGNLTGMENLELLASIKGKAKREDISNAMRRVGLEPEDKRRYRAYSAGMKRKLLLAQAIMEEPDLLIFDEPTNGLDEDSVKRFREVVRSEKDRGATCLIATHLVEDIAGLCDRAYKISAGRLSEIKEIVLEEE